MASHFPVLKSLYRLQFECSSSFEIVLFVLSHFMVCPSLPCWTPFPFIISHGPSGQQTSFSHLSRYLAVILGVMKLSPFVHPSCGISGHAPSILNSFKNTPISLHILFLDNKIMARSPFTLLLLHLCCYAHLILYLCIAYLFYIKCLIIALQLLSNCWALYK